jgi:hypothetical protein
VLKIDQIIQISTFLYSRQEDGAENRRDGRNVHPLVARVVPKGDRRQCRVLALVRHEMSPDVGLWSDDLAELFSQTR